MNCPIFHPPSHRTGNCYISMKATIVLLTLFFSTISIPLSACSSSFSLPILKPAIDYNQQGTTKYQRGDARGAIKDYDRAIAIDSKYVEAYTNRAVAKLGLGDAQGAIKDYSRAIEIDPQDALIYYNRGVAKFELGDNRGAISDFDRSISINPQDAETYSNRGAGADTWK